MEIEISARDELEAAQTTVKSEQSEKDDENESTPIRDEGGKDGPTTSTCAAGWETDDEDQVAKPPTPPPPPVLGLEMSLKRSPSNGYDNDNALTPDRISDEKSQTNGGINADSVPPVKKEEVKEERLELQLGFLDVLSEADFANIPSEYSQMEQVDSMDLEPPTVNAMDTDNEREMQAAIEKKYKELQQLERHGSEKKRKKHKKEKKHDGGQRKRRRSRSRSRSPRRHVQFTRISLPAVKPELLDLENVPVRECEKSVKIINLNKLLQAEAIGSTEAPLTISEKRQRAVDRVNEVLIQMRLRTSKAPATEFLVVDTIKKLPSSASYMSSNIFENPSPLCNNFNVNYKFNSMTATNINMVKWGIERLPEATIELMRLTGIDVKRLQELQLNTKLQLQKLRDKQSAAETPTDEPLITGLYKSVATQTEGKIGNRGRDVAVQAVPATYQGAFWLDPRFNETDLSQQHANVMLALKELSATMPSSNSWADRLFRALLNALAIKRAETKELAK